ncbi:MAG: glycosyl transferase [Cytophagaceae bacterium]
MSNTIAFTICSNNYLAQAISLAVSYLKFHPNHLFKIGLVDNILEDRSSILFDKIEVIPVSKLEIDGFEQLVQKYNIIELNTSVKPTYFKFIFKNYNAQNVIYLDPDILVFSSFDELEKEFENKNIIVTPHILTPIDDEYSPTDYHTLRGGVFNLGFIALSDISKVAKFLDWWHERVVKYGFADFTRNMFYDQLWLNYLPCLFDNYHILKHPGYNMANWNLHERVLTNKNDAWIVNNEYPLRFFHYSGYRLAQPQVMCCYNTRYDFNSRPDIKPVFDEYYNVSISNGWAALRQIKCVFEQKNEQKRKSIGERLRSRLYVIYRAVVKGY